MKAFYSIVLFALFCYNHVYAQYFAVDTFKGDSPYNKEVSFIFPQFKGGADPGIANDINKELVSSVLNIELGTQKYSVFENIWGHKEMDIPEVGDISFHIFNNDPELLSLSISATSCSADCEPWTRYYNFESSTGKTILLRDLLLGAGLQYISDSVKAWKTKRMQDYSDTLKYAIDKKPLSDDDKRDYKRAADYYAKCMQDVLPQNFYSLDKKQLVVHIAHCLPYDIQFLDKVDRDFAFDLGGLQAYLTDYGKKLLHY